MRGFFLLLLLSNVALVAWQYYGQSGKNGEVDVYRNILIVNNGLTLLSELPAEKYPALIDSEEEHPAEAGNGDADTGQVEAKEDVEGVGESTQANERDFTSAGPWCFYISDVDNKSELNTLIGRIREYGGEVVDQGKAQVNKDNFWVFLPAYPNRKKANEAAEILSKKRVRDFFVVRSGEHENAISLGVYSTKERAEVRYEEIATLKARLRKPKISILGVSTTHFNVTYQAEDMEKVKKVDAYLKEKKLLPAREISCK